MQIEAQHSQENLQSQRVGASAVDNATGPEAEVRAVLEQWQQALRERDVTKVLTFYADDVASYDLLAPLVSRGREPYRTRLAEWFGAFEGTDPVRWEIPDLHVTAGENVAHCNGLAHIGTPVKSAEPSAQWLQWSSGLRKTNGAWKFVFEHFSVPFDMETKKALTTLEP